MASREEKLASFTDPTVVASHSFNVVEGWVDGEGHLRAERAKVRFDDLVPFVEGTLSPIIPQSITANRRFRIISFPRLENGRLKLGFPQSTFEHIHRSWRLHNTTLEGFMNNNGVLSRFEEPDVTSIIMRVAVYRITGLDTVSVSHLRKENVTNVLYYSLEDEDELFDAFVRDPERCLQPAFFALLLYRTHQRRVERLRVIVDDEIVGVERESKFGGPGRLFGHRYLHEEPMAVDLMSDSVTKKLSYLQTELAGLGHLTRFNVDVGEWLVDMARRDLGVSGMLYTVDDAGPEWKRRVSAGYRKTLDEAEYVRRRSITVLSQAKTIRDRVQSQTTFFLNNTLHSQTDYTAAIAVETRRDSAAMKAIAALTMVFLPGTFVATLFSMNIFDWNAAEGTEPRVSKYLYVYWIVTIPLTLLVMFLWWAWFRKELQRFKSVRSVSDLEAIEKKE